MTNKPDIISQVILFLREAIFLVDETPFIIACPLFGDVSFVSKEVD
jgi:hypothetical protein